MEEDFTLKPTSPVSTDRDTVNVNPDSRRHKRQHRRRDEAKGHFEELSDAAERAHRKLEQMDSPYRFCVYEKDGQVYIDIVLLDAEGKISEVVKKNITHSEYSSWIEHIESGKGLLIDREV